MKKLLLFLTLLIVGMSANAQFSPSNNLNYIKLLKNPPIGKKADSVMVFDGIDKFVKMIPKSEVTEGKEDISNKISTIAGYSETLYPNEKATHDALDAKLNLSDLPSNLTLYATNVPSGVSTYTKWVSSLNDPDYNTTAVDIPTGAISGTAQLISGLSSIGGVIIGNPGIINVTTVGNIRRTSGTGTAKFYFELYKRTSAGVETLLGVSDFTLPVDFNTYSEFSATAVWNDGVFTETDRIVIKFYGSRIAGGGDPTFDFQFGGLTPVRTIVPVPFRVVAGEYELKANKQNSLAVDGTGIKYPTVDATNAGLDAKYSGSVTNNTLPKVTGVNTLGNSMLSDVSGELSLNQLSSSSGLKIKGFSNPTENLSMYVSSAGTSNIVSTRTLMLASGNATSIYIRSANSSSLYLNDLNISPIIIGLSGAPTLFNTGVTNGVDKVQVNGTVSASPATLSNQLTTFGQVFTSPTFTGVPSVPTATAGTNTTQIASTAFVNGAFGSGLYGLAITRIDATDLFLRVINNSSTTAVLEQNNTSAIFRQASNNSTGVFNRLLNEGAGTGNYNRNTANGIFNDNYNPSGGIFNNNTNSGTATFNYNINNTGVFNDSYNTGTGIFDKRRNDSTGILNYYNSATASTGDLQQYLKNGVVTSKINHLGEITVPKITNTGIQEYADNAAAITAGLVIGTHYRTGDLLKIVH